MTCVHLRKLYELCDENHLKFSSSDLVRIVCNQCEKEDVCPSVLVSNQEENGTSQSGGPGSASRDQSTSQSG